MTTETPKDDPAPPDGGEPQGANDDRPAMLGRRFRETLVTGMLIGLVLALGAHGVLVYTWYSANTISWFIVGIGGMVVGGALSLFLYGAATDRTDTGPKAHGQADVSERGEWSRTVERRRRRLRRR